MTYSVEDGVEEKWIRPIPGQCNTNGCRQRPEFFINDDVGYLCRDCTKDLLKEYWQLDDRSFKGSD